MSKKGNDKSIFYHPDVGKVFQYVFTSLISESDRGAILIAAEIVDSKLDALFRNVASESVSNKLLNKLLSYPGPLSTFSAKSEVAFSMGLIGENAFEAIKILRKIRNEAAHSKEDFQLNDHKDRLTELIKLGPNMVTSITSTASELLIRDAIDKVLAQREKVDEDLKEHYPSNREEALNFIKGDSEVMQNLEDRHPKMTLGVAVTILCSIIIKHQEKYDSK